MLSSLALPRRLVGMAILMAASTSLVIVAVAPQTQWVPGLILSFALTWAAAVDANRQALPDVLTLGLCTLGLAFAAAGGSALFWSASLGLVAGYGSLVTIKAIYARLRGQEGIGLGDAKLLAAGGAWLGWAGLPLVVLIASTTALAFALICAGFGRTVTAQTRIPFGPFLAIGIWAVWLGIPEGPHLQESTPVLPSVVAP